MPGNTHPTQAQVASDTKEQEHRHETQTEETHPEEEHRTRGSVEQRASSDSEQHHAQTPAVGENLRSERRSSAIAGSVRLLKTLKVN